MHSPSIISILLITEQMRHRALLCVGRQQTGRDFSRIKNGWMHDQKTRKHVCAKDFYVAKEKQQATLEF
jgi:hypothetical protein